MKRLAALGPSVLALFAAPGCAVPARPARPPATVAGVRTEHLAAPELQLHLIGVNGARIPDRALERSIATISRHTGRPVRMHDHGNTALDVGPAELHPSLWPGWDERIHERVVESSPRPHLLEVPIHGIAGFVAIWTRDEDGAEVPVVYPVVEPGTVLVLCLRGTRSGVTGYVSGLPRSGGAFWPGLVVLHERSIARRSGVLVTRANLWEWTLTHEVGHVLGLPGDSSHAWNAPGRGVHCTRPECVMYTGVDWRVIASGLLHGWPLDFCRLCAGELRQAREAVGRADARPWPRKAAAMEFEPIAVRPPAHREPVPAPSHRRQTRDRHPDRRAARAVQTHPVGGPGGLLATCYRDASPRTPTLEDPTCKRRS